MSPKAAGEVAPSVDASPSAAALDRVRRYLDEELGPSLGPGPPNGTGLARARTLFAKLGNPQDAVRTVHVAGTAGKGSVVAFVAGLLAAHGFSVGAHTSPHVYSLQERFTIDGLPVDAEVLLDELLRIVPAVEAMERGGHGPPSFFEVTNGLAFRLFADRADYSVIETGLGGLLDSTNTISRTDKLAVITPIGVDHVEVLGRTPAEIATQKAGILPPGGGAVAARSPDPAVDAAIRAEGDRRRCTVEFVDVETPRRTATTNECGTTLRLPGRGEMRLGMVGSHQAGNASLALRAVGALATRDGWELDPKAVREGLRGARLPGRFERRLAADRPAVLDGAHNPMKLAALVATLQELRPGARFPWVLAFKQDKDIDGALRVVAPVASVVVATEFRSAGGDHPAGTSVPAGRVASAAAGRGVPATVERDPLTALSRAAEEPDATVPVVVSGSFHLLAAVDGATVPQ